MSLKPHKGISSETHAKHDQLFWIKTDKGFMVIDSLRQPVTTDRGIVVPAGVRHNQMNKGLTVLVWGVAIALCLIVGIGLLLAAALMALALVVGPVLAAAILGFVLLAVGGLAAALRQRPTKPLPVQPEPLIGDTALPDAAQPFLSFFLAFVATRVILRRLDRWRGS